MPRAPRRCSPECKNPVTSKGKCLEHQPERIPWEKKDGQERPYLSSPEWARQRRRVLYYYNEILDGCALKLEGCTGKATTVDHKIPVWYSNREVVDDDELQGLCSYCHQQKSSYEGVQAKKIKKLQKDL